MKEVYRYVKNKFNFSVELEVTEGSDEGKYIVVNVDRGFLVKIYSKYLPRYFTYPITNQTKLKLLAKLKNILTK